MNKKLNELEGRIGYRFSDRQLLTRAMTHSSYANEHRLNKLECNERLEFLGDSVLEVVSSDFLYHKYPDKPEGDLTKIRASIVCEPTLAYCAEDIELGNYLLLGKGEEATGAIYLDGGFANAKEFILRFIMNDIEHKQLFFDSKTILQEIVQSQTEKPLAYELLREEGPDHNKIFESRALIGEEEIGRGTGRTKKAAEAVAAYHGILKLKKMEKERQA